ncbi:MAG: hypothetical protein IH921_14845 [Gemmatimonadetes bacterium]|nr:hypothetical protein [Gemmatimonadota bacterium]
MKELTKHATLVGSVVSLVLIGLLAASKPAGVIDDAHIPVHDPGPVTGVETAVLTHPPMVPPPITRSYATRVVVELETVEAKGRLADGGEYTKLPSRTPSSHRARIAPPSPSWACDCQTRNAPPGTGSPSKSWSGMKTLPTSTAS